MMVLAMPVILLIHVLRLEEIRMEMAFVMLTILVRMIRITIVKSRHLVLQQEQTLLMNIFKVLSSDLSKMYRATITDTVITLL